MATATTMRAVQAPRAGGPLQLVERKLPQPAFGEVRVRVQACGVCHSDSTAKEGLFPGIPYPIIPGHMARCYTRDATDWTPIRYVNRTCRTRR